MTDREKAIAILAEHLDHWKRLLSEGICTKDEGEKTIYALTMAIKALEQKWIPVSERLPEEIGEYLVTQKTSFSDYVYRSIAGYAHNLYDVDEYDFADKKRPGWYEYDSEWGYREFDNVIAWMPLPKPYKAESEDKE